jgi:hypothetical protein
LLINIDIMGMHRIQTNGLASWRQHLQAVASPRIDEQS